MLLERLAVQDLCENVRRVLLGPEVLNCHQSGAAHLPQLEQFAIDVTRMLHPYYWLCLTDAIGFDPCVPLRVLAFTSSAYGHVRARRRLVG